jgi:phage replication O-like protein O
MANPQLENGHVDIANELAEAFACGRLSGEEWQILWVILRKTWGWHKKEDQISLSQFALLSKMARPHICRTLKKLLSKKVIYSTKIGNKLNPCTYKFNKNYDEWQLLPKKVTTPKCITNIDNTLVPKMVHTKEKVTKEKDTYPESFLKFWTEYPKKQAKADALKAFKSLKPDDTLLDLIIGAIRKQRSTYDWQKSNGQFIPLPASWLNARRWEDELAIETGKVPVVL